MPDFFHVSKELRVGEVLAPGQWGHEMLAFGTRGRRGVQKESHAVNLIWEGALEAARLARFPEAVSRLDCVFAWFREEEARAFRDRFRADHKIYRVALIDPDTTVTIADYGVIIDAEPGPYVEMAAEWLSRTGIRYNRAFRRLSLAGPSESRGHVLDTPLGGRATLHLIHSHLPRKVYLRAAHLRLDQGWDWP